MLVSNPYRQEIIGSNTYWQGKPYRPRVPYFTGYHQPVADPSGVLKNAPTYLSGPHFATPRHAGQRHVRARMLYGHPIQESMWTPTQPVVPYCVNQRAMATPTGGLEVPPEPRRSLLRVPSEESELPDKPTHGVAATTKARSFKNLFDNPFTERELHGMMMQAMRLLGDSRLDRLVTNLTGALDAVMRDLHMQHQERLQQRDDGDDGGGGGGDDGDDDDDDNDGDESKNRIKGEPRMTPERLQEELREMRRERVEEGEQMARALMMAEELERQGAERLPGDASTPEDVARWAGQLQPPAAAEGAGESKGDGAGSAQQQAAQQQAAQQQAAQQEERQAALREALQIVKDMEQELPAGGPSKLSRAEKEAIKEQLTQLYDQLRVPVPTAARSGRRQYGLSAARTYLQRLLEAEESQ